MMCSGISVCSVRYYFHAALGSSINDSNLPTGPPKPPRYTTITPLETTATDKERYYEDKQEETEQGALLCHDDYVYISICGVIIDVIVVSMLHGSHHMSIDNCI